MQAAILYKTKKPLLVANIDLPKNLKFGQVLVDKYSGICESQINEIDAVKGKDFITIYLVMRVRNR